MSTTPTPLTATISIPKRPKRSKSTTTKLTHVIFLLDESGSMYSRASDVRGGFNAYVEQLHQDGQNYSLSLVKFANRPQPVFFAHSLSEVPLLDEKNYAPNGGTALLDAVDYAFEQARARFGTPSRPYGKRGEKVIFLVMTDGQENASLHATKERIAARTARREQAGNWTFVYMMAGVQQWQAESLASAIGITHRGNVLSYQMEETKAIFAEAAISTTATSGSNLGSSQTFFSGPISPSASGYVSHHHNTITITPPSTPTSPTHP